MVLFKRVKPCALAIAFAAAAVAANGAGAPAAAADKLQCRGCVGSKDIAKKAVKPKHLHDSAKPAGVEFGESNVGTALDTALKAIISAEVKAPGPGLVTVMASWYFSGNINSIGRCYLATAPAVSSGPFTYTRSNAVASFRDSTAMTRTFEVPAGTTTFYLNCQDDGTDMSVVNPLISALFVPQHY